VPGNLVSGEGRNHGKGYHGSGESAEKVADSACAGVPGGRARGERLCRRCGPDFHFDLCLSATLKKVLAA